MWSHNSCHVSKRSGESPVWTDDAVPAITTTANVRERERQIDGMITRGASSKQMNTANNRSVEQEVSTTSLLTELRWREKVTYPQN